MLAKLLARYSDSLSGFLITWPRSAVLPQVDHLIYLLTLQCGETGLLGLPPSMRAVQPHAARTGEDRSDTTFGRYEASFHRTWVAPDLVEAGAAMSLRKYCDSFRSFGVVRNPREMA